MMAGRNSSQVLGNLQSRMPRPLLEQPWILHHEAGQVATTTHGLQVLTNLDPIREYLGPKDIPWAGDWSRDIHNS